MIKIKTTGDIFGVGCVLIFVLVFVAACVGGYSIEYTLEFWLSRYKEVPVDVPFWLCAVLGIPLFWLGIICAVITYICSLVL